MASSPPPSESLEQTLPSPDPSVPPHDDHPQSPPHSDSHPSKTLTLASPIPQSPDPQNPGTDQNDDVPESFSSQTPRPSADDGDLSSVASAASTAISVYKRGTKRKKGGFQKKRLAQEKKSMKKLEVLNETLKPIPFAPVKNLDFSGHEKLLKRLGLWDFVHIEFDRVIRADLLAQLIATFNHGQRCSYVNGVRIMVNRADLARSLKLPVKKPAAAGASEGGGEEVQVATEESIWFIEAFVSNWLLLHDDTWMTPSEVVNWMKTIKEGNLEKLDWAGMIWFMIEKELLLAPQLADCYYASHLQYLMKSQKEELFLSREAEEEEDEEPKAEVKEDEEVVEEEDANGDVRMGGDEPDVRMDGDDRDVYGHGLEEHNTELSLGHDNVVEHDVELNLGQDNVVEKTDADKEADAERDADAGKDDLVADKEADAERDADAGKDDLVAVKDVENEEKEEKKEGVGQKEEQVVGDESAMDSEGCKEDDEPAQWFLDGKSSGGEPFLRQCSFGVDPRQCSFGVDPKILVSEDERKQEEDVEELGRDDEEEEEEGEEEEACEEGEEDEDEDEDEDEEKIMEMEEEQEEQGDRDSGFHLSPKGFPLDGLSSGGLIHSIDGSQINLSPGMSLRDPLAGAFLSSRDDARMTTLFGNGSTSKRGHIGLENDNSHHALNGNKRLRIDVPWDNSKSSSDFDVCMEQIQELMGKARMMYVAKEQASEESTMSQQILLNELQQRESVIDQLNRARIEEQQKRQIEVYRLERELNVMSNLLDGYRKALKENQRAFLEYRTCHPQHAEPLYKDVAGSAGLVLSAMELEKQRLKQEEEDRMNRLMFERKIKEFEEWWEGKFSALRENVAEWDNRLLSAEQELKLLKESYQAKRKVSETPEPAQNDP